MKARLALLLILLPLVGCADRRQAYKTANDTFASVMRDLTAARQAGLISDDEQREIAQIRDRVDKALDVAGVLLELGEGPSFDSAIDEVKAGLTDLLMARARKERK